MEKYKISRAKRAKPVEIISHWPKLIENLQFSSQDFYHRVEKAIESREIPEIKIQRVVWHEGGPLSPNREYLRLRRERLSFDICGAPFGTGFFVSLWCGEKPLRIGGLLWSIIMIILLVFLDWVTFSPYGIYRYAWRTWQLPASDTTGYLTLLILPLVIALLIRIGPNLDAVLLQTPVLGYFYERYFRSITYYRVDQMCMYEQAVRAAVFDVIDEITEAQGIQPLSEFERRPVMHELFGQRGSGGRR